MFAASKKVFRRPCTVECKIRALNSRSRLLKMSLFDGFGYSIRLANFNLHQIVFMKGHDVIGDRVFYYNPLESHYIKIEALEDCTKFYF